MTARKINSNDYFDNEFSVEEKLPRKFSVSFQEIEEERVRVLLNSSKQVGDIINDNAYKNDFYRFHDVFHYSFATLLGWSPCTRALLKCKRKSQAIIDDIEDGARATITEEALSMVIFNEAKRKNFFKGHHKISKTTLRIVKEMTETFEVSIRTAKEWETAILKSYDIFRLLMKNKGGRVEFNSFEKEIKYFP